VEGAVEQRCQRLLLKRSMLADHTLSAYLAALQSILLKSVSSKA
jgi:hypothetical protein